MKKKTKRVLTVNVDWDTDEWQTDTYQEEKDCGLPEQITIEQGALKELLENAKENETALADLLSDEWGSCVIGATLVKSKTKGLTKEEIALLFRRSK